MFERRLSRLFHLWALVLLVAIGLQATTPIAAPLQQTHGSAFSAATFEVAVARQRQDGSSDAVLASQPLDSGVPPQELHETALAAVQHMASALSDQSGPTAHRIRSWHPASRAPPAA